MLVILDPFLFDGNRPVDRHALESIVRLMRHVRGSIPGVRWYWDKVSRECIGPLVRAMTDRTYLMHLDELRHWTRDIRLPDAPRRITVWNFRTLFAGLGPTWSDTMLRIVSGCVLTGEPTILITCIRNGRNGIEHRHGHVVCVEKTCWNLRIRPEGHALTRIPCVCSLRNLTVPWTCRYDDCLPATADGAAFTFCPHPAWEKTSTEVFRTHEARHAWIDGRGNAWAKPSTGNGHHWDVYLAPDLEEAYGLGQLNIVVWGAPAKEGPAGGLHHVPEKKEGRLKKQTGWTC
jgi:hypothetical protein